MGEIQVPRPRLFDACADRHLTWWPELGVGYYPVAEGVEPYDEEYFARFRRQAATTIGQRLMAARVDFVEKHYRHELVDVGIGSGAFVELRNAEGRPTRGHDVNSSAVAWLRSRDLLCDPWRGARAVSLWDVLEHIPNFADLLSVVREWAFLSIPIFVDGEHVLRSKHYRRDEHVWYFTASGLISTFGQCGFDLVDMNDMETQIGREDIWTFAFRRRR